MRARLLIAVLAPGLALGCRQIIGIDDRNTEVASLGFTTPACASCAAARCDAEARACAEDAACQPLGACIAHAPPGDPGGRAACEERSPSGSSAPAYVALDVCLRHDCTDACEGLTGFGVQYGDKCDPCLTNQCADALRQCVADGGCERRFWRGFGDREHVTPELASRFRFRYAGADSFATLETAVDSCLLSCQTECAIRNQWQCVGAWDYALSKATHAKLALKVVDYAKGDAPAMGVDVSVCSGGGCVSAGQTDVGGRLDLALDFPETTGFGGFIRLTGAANGTKIPPFTRFFGMPLSEDIALESWVAPLASTDLLLGLLGNKPWKQDEGLVLVTLLDCTGYAAPGLTVEVTTPTNLDTYVTYLGGSATSNSGGAFAVNVPPGCVEITGKRNGQITHRQRVQANAHEFTTLLMHPLTTDGASAYNCGL